MADFNIALNKLLSDEGGYVYNPRDPGGATKYGITLKYLKSQSFIDSDINQDGIIDYKDVQLLSIQDVTTLYLKGFWEPNNIGQINSQRIANMVLGLCVNMGATKFIKIVQEAINYDGAGLVVDGELGPQTLNQINISNESALLGLIKDGAISYYNSLCRNNDSLKTFLQGWIKRVNSY